jgi:hypothetical protein
MSKRSITDYFSQNKKNKTSEPRDSHHDTDLDEFPTLQKKVKKYFIIKKIGK